MSSEAPEHVADEETSPGSVATDISAEPVRSSHDDLSGGWFSLLWLVLRASFFRKTLCAILLLLSSMS